MASPAEHTRPTAAEVAELSALADGTLDAARRPQVEARIAASPQLRALYERERRVVAALHEARASDRAPAALRSRIETRIGTAAPKRSATPRRRLAYAAGLAGALAVVALVLALALPSGSPGAPSVSDAAALATRGATEPPPAPDPSSPQSALHQKVGEVYFPNWSKSFGWRAVGARTDTLGGRRAVTVYYAWNGKRLAYTIIAAPPLAEPAVQPTTLHGTVLRTLTVNGRRLVTWRESGVTCILSGAAVSAAELQKLAAWSVPTAGR